MRRFILSFVFALFVLSLSGEAFAKRIVFLAGRPSHGYGSHEHYAGCMLLAKSLQAARPDYDVEVVKHQWPEDPAVLEKADCVIMYSDGGGGHPVNQHLKEIDALAEKGVGIVCIHYAVEVPAGDSGDMFLKWIGGYFEANWSVNPHWTAKFEKLPEHPITRGVKPFEINDEWYYHMRFREGMKGVTPILSDHPPASTLSRGDGAHSGNPHVRKSVADGNIQHVAWAAEREDGGRGFGFTGGHFHWNWGDVNFRKVMLNAIVWCAKDEVPEGGVDFPKPSLEELEANQDEKQPNNFNRDAIREKLNLQGSRPLKQAGKLAKQGPKEDNRKVKPVYESKLVTNATPGHAVEINADITGAKELYLVVSDGGDGFSCDWADWAEPRLVGPAGEKKLTDLNWKSSSAEWGNVKKNQNASGGAMKIENKDVAYGLGTHANSLIAFDLPEGYTQFKARGGLDSGGTNQGCGSTVQFAVYTQKPAIAVISAVAAGPESREPQDALAGLDVHADLQAELFAAEPKLLSPSNIDIDHLGRVWVCEIVNYRGHQNDRPEGDRILILEDADGDGVVEKETVFYQGRDIDSPHGVCVLATPDFKNTKVIVSAGDKVQVFTDENGDGKADRQETLFTGISGKQHDHGIHAFVFGPDGKLYFNFGNSGNQIKDKEGKPIIDSAGNEVAARRQPYQQGMVFRCNLDGSDFETLGWNFRNNWMATVDSFGAVWQSDNDDDGNKGVRINYVMEFGNYGYVDEFTGAGWKSNRTNLEKDVPNQHWHQNDPGVVPNLLLTGAGSPTGITVYEGDLLPQEFQGQVIHTDAGPNVVRAYPVKKNGAGYDAEILDILVGTRDKWFRPADVAVAPDGSLIVADWYDPGVGGHGMRDMERGRLFRITPEGHTGYKIPKFDFSTPAGAVEALKNPNYAVRYVAWQALHQMGDKAAAELKKMAGDENPRYRARALWLLAKNESTLADALGSAIKDKNEDIRCTALRMARQESSDVVWVTLAALVNDPSPQVRRECAVAIRDLTHGELSEEQTKKAAGLWAELALKHDGKDRWYLESLGIGADRIWDAALAAWLEKVGDKWNTPAGQDILWRSRAKQTPEYLAKIIKEGKLPEEEQARYFRAFDFLKGPEKDAALKSLLGL